MHRRVVLQFVISRLQWRRLGRRRLPPPPPSLLLKTEVKVTLLEEEIVLMISDGNEKKHDMDDDDAASVMCMLQFVMSRLQRRRLKTGGAAVCLRKLQAPASLPQTTGKSQPQKVKEILFTALKKYIWKKREIHPLQILNQYT